jgi:hypothetical protein
MQCVTRVKRFVAVATRVCQPVKRCDTTPVPTARTFLPQEGSRKCKSEAPSPFARHIRTDGHLRMGVPPFSRFGLHSFRRMAAEKVTGAPAVHRVRIPRRPRGPSNCPVCPPVARGPLLRSATERLCAAPWLFSIAIKCLSAAIEDLFVAAKDLSFVTTPDDVGSSSRWEEKEEISSRVPGANSEASSIGSLRRTGQGVRADGAGHPELSQVGRTR